MGRAADSSESGAGTMVGGMTTSFGLSDEDEQCCCGKWEVAMNVVLNGGDPDYVALLPSGFAILPDRTVSGNNGAESGEATAVADGSLLTVAFQILVDSVLTAKLSLGSVATINNLIACTVERIKAALLPKVGLFEMRVDLICVNSIGKLEIVW
ncbi:Homeobox-leucine zipper protein HDG2 [Linum perenne]